MAVKQFFSGLFVAALCSSGASAQQYKISTIAGNHTQGFSGDNGPATSAELAGPARILVDSSGKIYICDGLNHRVRVISSGTISTIAGDGTAGYSGDTKAATSAELNDPTGIALDSSGDLYIADSENNVVRKVSGGNITTFAGNHTTGYSGDTAAATSAQLDGPVAVAVDSAGNVYIADAFNNVVREVTTDGNINTILGGAATTLQLSQPDGLAIDSTGALYVANAGSRQIIKFSKGVATVVAGNGTLGVTGDGGPAINAGLGDPMGLAVDSAGNLFIADTINGLVRKVTKDGIITTIAGDGLESYFGDGGLATHAALYFPRDVAVDGSGKVFIADTGNNVIRLLTPIAASVSAKGIVNAANFKAPISPGALASLFGTGFVSQNVGSSLPLNTLLDGVAVNVNGKASPILYITPNQINFQVPWETAIGTASVTVTVNGHTSDPVSVEVAMAAPGLFLSSGRAAALNSDSTPNTQSNPAKAGSTISAFLTGSGPVSQHLPDGVPTPESSKVFVTSSTAATIGNASAHVSFAGLAPTFVGLLQVNIDVPSDLASGSYPLTVTIAGQKSNSGIISVTQ